MEDLAIGAGMLLAVAGPLLLIPVIWLVYRLAMRPVIISMLGPGVSRAKVRWIALALSLLLVAVVLAVAYFPGKQEFDRLCAMHATPTVSGRVTTSGFYRTPLYSYMARRFLDDGSFTFVEAPYGNELGAYVRYSKTDTNEVIEEMIAAPVSHYGVSETLSELSHGIIMTEKLVYETATGRELARAASIVYQGGPLALLLGVYGMSSCPDARSAAGSEHFNTFYNLETITLRAASRN